MSEGLGPGGRTSYGLGVDLGTTFVAAATAQDGRVEMFTLGDRTMVTPAVVFARDDGSVITGEAANRRAVSNPERVGREFKRRLGDPTPVMLGGEPHAVTALLAALLSDAVSRVTATEGAAPERVVLTHPANWGPYRRELFEEVPHLAGVAHAVMVTEPEAAAAHYAAARHLGDGDTVAVYDLGGGTFDATVLRKRGIGIDILGTPEGIERLGGVDFDDAILAHINYTSGGALTELDMGNPQTAVALARLRADCVAAKEALSVDTEATIPVFLPSRHFDVRLTRAEFEDMIRAQVESTIGALTRTLRSARVEPADLSAVLLVGGSSRIPLVGRMITEALGRPTVVDTHPKYAVALGAATLAAELAPGSNRLVAPTVPAPRAANGGTPVSSGAAAAGAGALAAGSLFTPGAATGASRGDAVNGSATLAARSGPAHPEAEALPDRHQADQRAHAYTDLLPRSRPEGAPTEAGSGGSGGWRPGWSDGEAPTDVYGRPGDSDPRGPYGGGPYGSGPHPRGPVEHGPAPFEPGPYGSGPHELGPHDSGPHGRRGGPESGPVAAPPRRRGLVLVALAAVLLLLAGTVAYFMLRSPSPAPVAAPRPGATPLPAPAQPTAERPVAPAPSVPIPSVAGEIPVGSTPGFVAINPSGKFAYVANRAARVVTVVDTAIDKVVATIPIADGPPQYLAFAPDGSRLYVSVFNDPDRSINRVVVLDTQTNSVVTAIPVGSRPFALAVRPDGAEIYVPNHDSGTVSVIDTQALKVVTDIRVKPNPHWVEFSKDGTRAYTANHESNLISVIDTGSRAVVAEIPVEQSPHSVAVHPTRPLVANVNYDSGSVTVIDTDAEKVIATVPVGQHPQDVTWAPDGRHLYVTNVDSDTMTVITADGFTVTATVPTGEAPTSVAVPPDGRHAYVTNLNAGTLTVLDLTR